MEQRHETFVGNIRQDLDIELKKHNHGCALCLASVRNVTHWQLEKFRMEETVHIYNTRNTYRHATKQETDQTSKLQESHEIEIANLQATHEAQATSIREESERTLSSLKAEHNASIERLKHDHEGELERVDTYHVELHEHHNNLVDRLNEGHLQELNKLNADCKAKLSDACEHTRHDGEYIAQIDVLNEKIMKQHEAIQIDAQGIREDAEMIAGLRSQFAELEDKITERKAELKKEQDRAHEHRVSWLEQHSELITTQWAVAQLEKDLRKVEADLEKGTRNND